MTEGEKKADGAATGNASPPNKKDHKPAPKRNLLKKKVNANNAANNANSNNATNIGTNSPLPTTNTGTRTPGSTHESPLTTKNKTSPGTRNLRRAPAHLAVAASYNGAKVGADGKLIAEGKSAEAKGKSAGTLGGGEGKSCIGGSELSMGPE
jgi:hypothetical protein